MNALLFERPVWFATGPLIIEEEAQEMEDATYHQPVLVNEVIDLVAPRSLFVDATCGGGGHSEAILQTNSSSFSHWGWPAKYPAAIGTGLAVPFSRSRT